LQAAAVIGTHVPFAVLMAVAGVDEQPAARRATAGRRVHL
jgi:hypothetical protein